MRDDDYIPTAPLKIAVVGAGISGLSAAWLLSERHDVTLFEKENRLGGHSNTVTSKTPSGPIDVDTGFIVYNTVNYPNLVALFDHLNVPTKPSDMSFAVSLDDGALEYAGTDLSGVFAQKSNLFRPRFWAMLKDLLRFYREAPALLGQARAETITLGDFLAKGNYSEAFIADHLLPMGAAIWSTPMAKMLDFPALAFVRFCDSHGLLKITDRPQWRTVHGGSKQYVRRINDALVGQVKTGAGVVSVARDDLGVTVRDASGAEGRFDHVVMACHADQALNSLADADSLERAYLSPFKYEKNQAVLHQSASLMPKRRSVWCSWNYLGRRDWRNDGRLALTYWMNRLQGIDDNTPLFVTLNPAEMPDDDDVLNVIDYMHPLFDQDALAAQPKLWSLQGRNRTWYCGSYFGYGFHEDGLQSGLAVAEQLGGVRRPWTVPGQSGRITITGSAARDTVHG